MAEATPPVNRFGPYTVHGKIGSGGMAVVYKAFNEETQKTVALKILRSTMMEQADVVERFKQEAKIAERLRHAHIVAVNNYGSIRGRYFLELQYMAGGTLAERFAKPVEIGGQEVVRMLRHIASALDYAHRQGVIHRDIKLENVLIDDKGSASLSDFSIARLNDGNKLTATGFVVGTPMTIAPEQARGDVKLDYRADLYSLAVIAYVLAVGRYPFNGSNPLAILHQHLAEPVPPPSIINSSLPKGLDAVLLKGLAKQPGERYPSADMLVEAFARVVSEQSMSRTVIDIGTDIAGKKIELPQPKRAESAEDWMQKALSTTDQDEVIRYLKRALEIEPFHSKANRLLFQVEGAVPQQATPKPKPAVAVTASDLSTLKKATKYGQKQNPWTVAIGIAAAVVIISVIFFYLMLGGSPIATQIANLIQGKHAVTQIDGVPIEQVPDAVMKINPQDRTAITDGQLLKSTLDNGFSSAYIFDVAEGQTFDISVLFVDTTAVHVSKNVAVLNLSGNDTRKQCDKVVAAGDTGVYFSCRIDENGQWSVRVLGITGESVGRYQVYVDRTT